jgi:hypothetical protein
VESPAHRASSSTASATTDPTKSSASRRPCEPRNRVPRLVPHRSARPQVAQTRAIDRGTRSGSRVRPLEVPKVVQCGQPGLNPRAKATIRSTSYIATSRRRPRLPARPVDVPPDRGPRHGRAR